MKGANGEVWAKINKIPNNTKITKIGIIQNFFLIFRKFQNSTINDNFLISLFP